MTMSVARPCRSSSAPAIGLTRSPGKIQTNVTIPAISGEPYTWSAKRTTATPIIVWPMRASCIPRSTRPSCGTRRRAR